MLRFILGIVLAAILVYPGTLVVRGLLEGLELNEPASFSDGCLVIIIILLCILLLRKPVAREEPEEGEPFRTWRR